MFSSSRDPIPEEIIASGILPFLPLQDLIAFRQVCRQAQRLSDNGPALSQRIKNLYGDNVIGDARCREKFIIRYLFEKGMHYLRGYAETDISKLLKRACDYFAITKAQIKVFGAFHETEQPAIDYMLGFILVIAENYDTHENVEQRQADIQQGLALLKKAANKNHDKAMLMLAVIYSPHIAALPIPGTPGLIPAGQMFSFQNDKEGFHWLDLAYKANNPLARILYACSLLPHFSYSEPNEQKAIEILTKLLSEGIGTATMMLADLAAPPPHDIQSLNEKMLQATLDLYQLASHQGNLEATLAMVAFHGKGTFNDRPIRIPRAGDELAAIEFLNTAYKQGSNYAALHLGILHLTGSLSLTNHREIHRWDAPSSLPTHVPRPQLIKVDSQAAIKYFEQGALVIKNADFSHAIKCTLQLAYYYLKKYDLKNALKWFQHGAGFGDLTCTMEIGYLHLHHHAELKLINGRKRADELFEEAFLIHNTPPHQNLVADFFSAREKNDIRTDRHVNLQQYIKWKIRVIHNKSLIAFSDLKELFESKENPFDLYIKNPELVTFIRHVQEDEQLHPASAILIDLAARCYQAANVPVLEDPTLLREATSKSPSPF